MSLLHRAWREIRRPLSYATVVVGAILGITTLGMLTRGLLVEGAVPVGDLVVTLVGAAVLLGVGVALHVRAPG